MTYFKLFPGKVTVVTAGNDYKSDFPGKLTINLTFREMTYLFPGKVTVVTAGNNYKSDSDFPGNDIFPGK